MGEGVKYQSLGSHNKSLVGDKLVTTAARPATVQVFFFFWVEKLEMSINFFFSINFMGNVY